MLNVYPVEISYTRTNRDGVLAGIPVNCTFGVDSVESGKDMYEALIAKHPECDFTNFKINQK